MAKPKLTPFVPAATRQAALVEARKTAATARQKADKALRAATLKQAAQERAEEDRKKYIIGGFMLATYRKNAAIGQGAFVKVEENIERISSTLDATSKDWFVAAMSEEMAQIKSRQTTP